jgi:hypothetical protein
MPLSLSLKACSTWAASAGLGCGSFADISRRLLRSAKVPTALTSPPFYQVALCSTLSMAERGLL